MLKSKPDFLPVENPLHGAGGMGYDKCNKTEIPPTFNWANTIQCLAWIAPLVIQYFCAKGVGVLTMNSSVFES